MLKQKKHLQQRIKMKKIISSHSKRTLTSTQEKNTDIAIWMRFLKEQKLGNLFETLSDSRQQTKVSYSMHSLCMWAFSLSSFRQPSKHAMQTKLENLSSEQKKGLRKLLKIKGKNLPHSSTVDHALASLPYEELNLVLLKGFDSLLRKKWFYNHQNLIPERSFFIGLDGCWIQKYDHPHACDQSGKNTCPYCLPRTANRGKKNEKTYWVHVSVIATLITPYFALPLYMYPLKAKQVSRQQNDERLKQECELTAAYEILPLLKKKYPRLPMIFLGDALYANEPFIRFCEALKMDYSIVLKENAKAVNRKCDELSQLPLYQKAYTRREITKSRKGQIKKTVSWFNRVCFGKGSFSNVLRFKEEILNEDGTTKLLYKCCWICSRKISKHNCFERAAQARMRWKHEDLHNTCKNRGFELKHDMARANPNLQMAWKLITLIAVFFFEIFRHSKLAITNRGKKPLIQFAKDMLGQILNISWEIVAKSLVLQRPRVQFRFCFESKP